MNTSDRDALWRKYLSAKWFGGTPAECQTAFDRWWELEFADSVAMCAADVEAQKLAASEENRKKALKLR